jgi:membrane-bound serine protease (ClpP class)
MNEILGAQVRSFAKERGRNPELAARAVFEAKAWSSQEALDLGLIDAIAQTRSELLEWLDGRTLRRVEGEELGFTLEGYRILEMEMSWRERALSLLADPNIAYVLLLIGIFGVLMELYNPGLIVPGVVGVLALLLFAFSVQILPINVVGVILILAAVAFFIAEVKIVSYGLLTAGGILCLLLGGLMLIGEEVPHVPQLTVNPMVVVPVAITLGLLVAVMLYLVVKAQRRRISTGQEGLVGQVGTAATDLDLRGRVFVQGEYWDAQGSEFTPQGAEVRVTGIENLRIRVETLEPGPGERKSDSTGEPREGE